MREQPGGCAPGFPLFIFWWIAGSRLATRRPLPGLVARSRPVVLAAVAQPDQMFSLDRFAPSAAGYRRTAKAVLPSVLAALGLERGVPFGHHAPRGDPVR